MDDLRTDVQQAFPTVAAALGRRPLAWLAAAGTLTAWQMGKRRGRRESALSMLAPARLNRPRATRGLFRHVFHAMADLMLGRAIIGLLHAALPSSSLSRGSAAPLGDTRDDRSE